MINLKDKLRTVPDFPVAGITFFDLLPAISHGDVFRDVIEQLCQACSHYPVTKVAGIDARGLIFGAPLAYRLGAGFIPLRKSGKLPGKTVSESYSKEYGADDMSIQHGVIAATDRVLIVDDIIATGGTALAAERLVSYYTENISHLFLLELSALNGMANLAYEHRALYSV
jgi:adenine phosphoribosyltransferase